MKRLFSFLFILTGLVSYGQVGAKIGMSPILSFTPASATSSLSTVTYSNNISFTSYVKNYGTASFSGTVSVQSKRDTVSGVMLDTVNIAVSLGPNDSVAVVSSFTPSQGLGAFLVAGNGNTIVVWPYIIPGTALPGDSVRATIWVSNVMTVFEFEKNQFNLYPNPVTHDLTIKPLDGINYKNIIIYDMFARKIKELSFKEIINVSELNAGSYWMIINSDDKSYRINFIKD